MKKMFGKTGSRNEFIKKITLKNRLIIINEDTFEELFSFKLNSISIFVTVTLSAIFLIIITTILIAFTPLRELIPGYSSSKLKRDATELALKSDSLSIALQKNQALIESIQKVLRGELEYAKYNKDSILELSLEEAKKNTISASQSELELREQVAKEAKKHQKENTKNK